MKRELKLLKQLESELWKLRVQIREVLPVIQAIEELPGREDEHLNPDGFGNQIGAMLMSLNELEVMVQRDRMGLEADKV